MKPIILILLVVALSQSAIFIFQEKKESTRLNFKLVGQFTKDTTWESFAGFGETPTIKIQKVKGQTHNKDRVRKEVYSWWTDPIGENLQDDVKAVSETKSVDNKTTTCYQRVYQFSKSGYLTMNIDQPSSTVYPGGFIQGKSIKTGAQPLSRLTIGSADRFPIQVATPAGFIDEASPTADNVLELIRKNLAAQKNDVWVGFVKTEDLPSVYEALNFNSRVVQKIGISSVSAAKSDRIYIFMLQTLNEYYPAMLSPDESFIDDAIGVFFKNSFNLDKALELEGLKLWGRDNIPCYVDRALYGRFLAVSVAFNQKNKAIYEEITSSTEADPDKTAKKLAQIFADPTLLAYGKGPYSELDSKAVKSGDWYKFFGELPPVDPQNKKTIEPIAFSLKDFRDQSVKFSNAIKYKVEQCTPK